MTDDFLVEIEKDSKAVLPHEERLGRLTELARLHLQLQEEIEDIEVRLAARKEALRQVSERDIPELMHEIGMRGPITLSDGRKLSITPFYNGKITSEDCYTYLQEHDAGDLVKVNMTVQCRMSDEGTINNVRKLLHENRIEWDENQGVHPSTLKAWIKDTISSGKPIDRELFNVYTGWKTIIK